MSKIDKATRAKNERILRLAFIEQELSKHGTVTKEYHFVHEIVGKEPGITQRIADAGLKNWRFDYAIVSAKVAVEYEGVSTLENNPDAPNEKSAHLTFFGYTDDTNKYNTALLHGWKILRYTVLNYKNITQDLQRIFPSVSKMAVYKCEACERGACYCKIPIAFEPAVCILIGMKLGLWVRF